MLIRSGTNCFHLPLRGAARWLLGAALLALIGLAGCAHQQTRLQSEEETERDRYQVATVRDKSSVGNAQQPLAVSGVGLVEGLEGTGCPTPSDGYRSMLEKELTYFKEKNIKELLSSPHKDTALVLVSGSIPPGARKGEAIDVEVTLPRDSRATSLRGGRLRPCRLYNYDFANRLSPGYTGSAGLLMGHPIAEASGPVLAGLGGTDDEDRQRQGRIWGGGRTKTDQPLSLVMNSPQQFKFMTAQIADRVNETFQAGMQGTGAGAVAYTNNNFAVYLRVPAQYRLNIPRFLRVVLFIPLQETPESSNGSGRRTYRQRLAEDLLDPTRTVSAALRLEALGQRSLPALKKGLEHKHPLVRFCSAEALLYLGSPAGTQVAADAALEQPLLRAFALTALASLDEGVCQEKLAELVAAARDDETRYGAFRALYNLDEQHPAVRGERLNEAFWLHRTAKNSPPLVHVSTTKRAEIVLFGEEAFFRGPFAFLAGEFTVTTTEKDPSCTVSRIPLRGAPVRRQCSLSVEEVLRTMADLGAGYPEVVNLLQQADKCECVTCRVRFDAVPQAASIYELVKAGRATNAENELLPAGQDLGGTPTLYETGTDFGSAQERQGKTGRAESKARADRQAAPPNEPSEE
jgi:hypothetical protein